MQEAYKNLDRRWLLLKSYAAAEPVSAAPFEAISFDLGLLWAD
jgi:hypothetical protein